MTPPSDPMGDTTSHDPTSERVELKPCPFCDAKISLNRDPKTGYYGPDGHHKSQCPINLDFRDYAEPAQAVREWNTRTQPASLLEGERVEAIIRTEVGDACYDDIRWRSTREIVERCILAALSPPAEAEQGREMPEGERWDDANEAHRLACVLRIAQAYSNQHGEDMIRAAGILDRLIYLPALSRTPDTLPKGDVADRDAIRAEAMEEAARVADRLGGDRVHPRLPDDPRDREGRTNALINGQHVRAQSIAAAIRQRIVSAREEGADSMAAVSAEEIGSERRISAPLTPDSAQEEIGPAAAPAPDQGEVLAKVRKALEPFARDAARADKLSPANSIAHTTRLRASDLRRAREALSLLGDDR